MGARMGGVGLELWGQWGCWCSSLVLMSRRRTSPVKCFSSSSRLLWPRRRWKWRAGSISSSGLRSKSSVKIPNKHRHRAPRHLCLHLCRRHRTHRLSTIAGDLRSGARKRYSTGGAHGHRGNRLVAGDQCESGFRGDSGHDRLARVASYRIGADPHDLHSESLFSPPLGRTDRRCRFAVLGRALCSRQKRLEFPVVRFQSSWSRKLFHTCPFHSDKAR